MIEVLKYRPIDKGSVKGVATLKIEEQGMQLDCTIFEKEGKKWLSVKYYDFRTNQIFQERFFESLDKFLKSQGDNAQGEIPF